MKNSTSQKGFSPILLLVIVAVVGIAAYFGFNYYKSKSTGNSFLPVNQVIDNTASPSGVEPSVSQGEENPTPTLEEISNEVRSQILSDIVDSEGISCDLKDANGNVVKDQCKVDRVVGNFAKGTMPMAYWITEKTGNTWKVVLTGNGIPKCEEVDEQSVPKEIYGNCIEASGELRF